MTEKGSAKKVNITFAMMCLGIVVIISAFFLLTIFFIRRNIELQTQMAADTIMENVENELFSFDEVTYILAKNSGVVDIVTKGDGNDFFDSGALATRRIEGFLGSLRNTDCIAVYDAKGRFYRLKGNASNTVLKRTFYLAENSEMRTLNIHSGNENYIGIYERIADEEDVTIGYVVALSEQSNLRHLLGEYNELDYLGACLFSGADLICSSHPGRDEDILKEIDDSIFAKEKEIGLSGLKLLVYCDNTLLQNFSTYFVIAFPLMIAILIAMSLFYFRFMRSHIRTSFELDMERTHLSLLKKQISAHFTVNTLNVIRALVNKGDRDAAASTCDELSQLLRYANGGDEYISLMEEFNIIEQYILIMQTRYPGRIEVKFAEEDYFSETYIPRMLIQPIVENAVVHGISGRKGKIEIGAIASGQVLYVIVTDDGKGMDNATYEKVTESINSTDSDYKKLESIALGNIQKRIRMLCGEGYGIEIESAPGKGTKVAVKLPLVIREEEI